jgi:hypothetical protein
MEFEYGMVVCLRKQIIKDDTFDVVHFIGYRYFPTFRDYVEVWKELDNDKDFEYDIKDIVIMPASDEMVEHYQEDAIESEQDQDFKKSMGEKKDE